jgi:hypothetical protein
METNEGKGSEASTDAHSLRCSLARPTLFMMQGSRTVAIIARRWGIRAGGDVSSDPPPGVQRSWIESRSPQETSGLAEVSASPKRVSGRTRELF